MKPEHVAALVDGAADAFAARAAAEREAHAPTSLRLRVEACETLLGTIVDVLLAGTSADPDAPVKKGAKKGAK